VLKSYEQRVCDQMLARREHGLKKYGVGVERTDLTAVQWVQHALEEAMDFAVYLERLKDDLDPKHLLPLAAVDHRHIGSPVEVPNGSGGWIKETLQEVRYCEDGDILYLTETNGWSGVARLPA
jgi:hypothetical protein